MSERDGDDFQEWLLGVAAKATGMTPAQITKAWAKERRQRRAAAKQRARDLLDLPEKHWSETEKDEDQEG